MKKAQEIVVKVLVEKGKDPDAAYRAISRAIDNMEEYGDAQTPAELSHKLAGQRDVEVKHLGHHYDAWFGTNASTEAELSAKSQSKERLKMVSALHDVAFLLTKIVEALGEMAKDGHQHYFFRRYVQTSVAEGDHTRTLKLMVRNLERVVKML